MSVKLSEGAIADLMAGRQVSNPVLQILGAKKIPATAGSTSGDRYRLFVSDGKNSHPFAMLATQLNDLYLNGEMDSNSVMRVEKFICNQVQGDKRVMIILELTMLASGAQIGKRLGNPVPFTSTSTTSSDRNFSNESTTHNVSNKQNKPQQSTPQRKSSATSDISSNYAGRVFPISSLTPYQNRWTIRARVTSKSNIRTWSNSKGEGKLFSVTFIDESGEIRATAFNDECDMLFPILEENKVYYVSQAQLKTANKTFSNVNNNFELTFRRDSVVEPCNDSCPDLPTVKYDFTAIDKLSSLAKDSIVDVIGVCKSSGDLQEFTSRATNRDLKKRDLFLVDQSNTQITLTLWGDQAESFDGYSNPVVAVKSCRLTDFNGCSLSLNNSSSLQLNPEIPEAFKLKGWFDRVGSSTDCKSLSTANSGSFAENWKYLCQVNMEKLGSGDKADFFNAYGTVVMIKKENCLYKACSTVNCNKKTVDQGNGFYRCEKCNKETDEYKWRFLLQMNISDFTGNLWVTCFQEAAEIVLGIKADELGALQSTNEKQYQEIFSQANFKEFNFKLKTKAENFNDEIRTKTTVVGVNTVNFQEYNRKLLADLEI